MLLLTGSPYRATMLFSPWYNLQLSLQSITNQLAQLQASSLLIMDHIITIDKDILGGVPVFTGTRVPVESLIDHLQAGVSVDDFLADFPTVTKEQVMAFLSNKTV
jgi:uncharacterized protein (DUF433 family)